MRLPNAVHESSPWVIAEIAPDFRLLDVWALPVEGRADEFGSFLEVMTSLDPSRSPSAAARALFRLRFRLGALFGWDDRERRRPIPGSAETALRARLPAHLRDSAREPAMRGRMERAAGGFVPLYRTDDEWAAEISNDTVHAVMHVAWVRRAEDRYRAQMAVYVKPRGRLGEIYMKLIAPFRHAIVYPALMRQIGRAWDDRRL
jgi:Protein of unknown function (DUF2867)